MHSFDRIYSVNICDILLLGCYLLWTGQCNPDVIPRDLMLGLDKFPWMRPYAVTYEF